MAVRPLILGCRGEALTVDARRAFAEIQPWGLILFDRNCRDPERIRHLCQDFRDAVGRDAPVFVDQEGGRIQRLKPPIWRRYPPAAAYGLFHRRRPRQALEAALLAGRGIAADLRAVGIGSTAAPVLDVPVSGAHEVIGDRAFGADPALVSNLGRAFHNGLLDGGVLPIVKHIPGHGRARLDSHEALPVVEDDLQTLQASDFVPFRELADAPAAMTAHIVFSALDADYPVTLSGRAVAFIRNELGFAGTLISDDLRMKALQPYGRDADNAAAAFAAGCDIVLDGGDERRRWEDLAAAAPPLQGDAKRRADIAMATIGRERLDVDRERDQARFGELIAMMTAGRRRPPTPPDDDDPL